VSKYRYSTQRNQATFFGNLKDKKAVRKPYGQELKNLHHDVRWSIDRQSD